METTYKWNIEIILHCGEHIHGVYECTHSQSTDVAKELFVGEPRNLAAMAASDGTKQMLFRLGDVSAAYISAPGAKREEYIPAEVNS